MKVAGAFIVSGLWSRLSVLSLRDSTGKRSGLAFYISQAAYIMIFVFQPPNLIMINLPVDEAYAFDYLTILKIKSDVNSQNPALSDAYEHCLTALRDQLGQSVETILSSPEYHQLLQSNRLTFDAVDRARNGDSITAKEVDDCNMERFRCKMALQQRFFNGGLVETKISR